jgi:hypothetical protein
MKQTDLALTFSKPRLLTAVYFGLLSILPTVFIDGLLKALGNEEIIPIYELVFLGIIVAASMGALFGEHIIHCKKPYKVKTFWLGFIMVIASLPIFDLGVVFFIKEDNAHLFSLPHLHHLLSLYLAILAYSYVIFGVVLAIASGIAAMYLREQLIYDILKTSKKSKQKLLKRNISRKIRIKSKV